MTLSEGVRLLQPAAHVRRASDDERVVLVDITGAIDALDRSFEPAVSNHFTDALGNPPRGSMSCGIRNEDLRGRTPLGIDGVDVMWTCGVMLKRVMRSSVFPDGRLLPEQSGVRKGGQSARSLNNRGPIRSIGPDGPILRADRPSRPTAAAVMVAGINDAPPDGG